MEKAKIIALEQDFLDVLFAGRNKAYGAYQLRKRYDENLGKAFGVTLLSLLLLFGSLYLADELVVPHGGIIPAPPPPIKIIKYSDPVINIPEQPMQPAEPLKPTKAFIAPIIGEDLDTGFSKFDGAPKLKPGEEIGSTEIIGTPSGGTGDLNARIIESPKPDTFMVAQEQPEFIGGEEAMYVWLKKNMYYPDYAIRNGLEGRVVVRFLVDQNGEISNMTVLTKASEFDGDAVRAVGKMPRWKPGRNNGKPVPVWMNLPVKFELQQ